MVCVTFGVTPNIHITQRKHATRNKISRTLLSGKNSDKYSRLGNGQERLGKIRLEKYTSRRQ